MSEEKKIDLSSFDGIADRVARAKAKAEAMRAAKAAGGAHPAVAPRTGAPAPGPRREVNAEAIAAKKAQAKARTEAAAPAAAPSPPGGNGVAFCAGMVIRRNGKLAKIISTSYENVCLVYEDNPREQVMTKRYRLDVERQRGQLQFASAQEFKADIPSGVGKWGRRLAFLAAAGFTGIFFLGMGLWIGPLNLFPTMLVGYLLFALAHHFTK